MDVWHVPYESILAMPVTRRRRLLKRKIDLERERQQKHETAISSARARSSHRRR